MFNFCTQILSTASDLMFKVSSILFSVVEKRSFLLSEQNSVCAINSGFVYIVNCCGLSLFFNLRYVLNTYRAQNIYVLLFLLRLVLNITIVFKTDAYCE